MFRIAYGGLDIAEQPGYLEGEVVFGLNNPPTPQCHALAMIHLQLEGG